jgi:hypothetical protein
MSVVAQSPMPYLPIRIVDVSPDHSPVRRPPASPATGARRAGRRVGAAAVAVLALAAIAANVGAAPFGSDASGDFRLAPGHAMPAQLGGDVATHRQPDFRLAPGHAVPPSLTR